MYNYCLKNCYCLKNWNKGRVPIKGQSGPGLKLLGKLTHGKKMSIPLQMLGVDEGKQQVMNRLSIKELGEQYFHFSLDGDKGMEIRGYDQIYLKGLISEQKKKVKKNGIITTAWEQVQGVRNEPLDLRVYNIACTQSIRPDWAKMYEAVNGRSQVREEKPAEKKTAKPTRIKSSSLRLLIQTNIW